jgi:UDP-N-acetylmuramoyl-tripeptide--D-alanyl-D-alanine ligase
LPVLVVEDTLQAYGDMAGHHRRELARPVVAVTGSNGKTTTKELIAAAFGPRGPVHKTQGNFNNLIGVPKTLLDWQGDEWVAVVEMGMSVPGEIGRLSSMGAASVGVITNVAAAHLEGLGSLESVARAKGELFDRLPENAVGVVNLDDPLITSVCAPLLGRRDRLTFGEAASADVRLCRFGSTGAGLRVELEVDGRTLDLELPLSGLHNAYNCAAAVAACLALGSTLDSIMEGITTVKVPGSRLRVLRTLPVGVNVIDDTYNANPASMGAAFATLGELGEGVRRVAVLGEMFELGEAAAALHEAVGRDAADRGVHWVLGLGEHAGEIAQGAREGGAAAQAFEDVEALQEALHQGLQDDDWILVKGSRGMRMERIVQYLEGLDR